ncbi:MAG TPA: MBL fold metallo-hydrolase [Ktedonobacterales bacterium]|nr:MBL fold metallo-hydrolase [Ktedonobacterales bacterium]
MQLANGLTMLDITATITGRTTTICPTVLWDDANVVLVDTGYPGQLPLFREALEQAGFPFEKLSKIIATHQDIDHIGSLSDILNAAPHKIEVLATEADKPYIQGEKMLIKFTPEVIARALASLPAEMPEEQKQAFKHRLENPPRGPVDTTLADGESLPYGGGVIVIHTPGHTPGHLCLYHPSSKTLIAADALGVVDGRLARPRAFDFDTTLAATSLKKLARYEIETVLCYHGGLYRGDANQRIAELAAEA